MAILHRHLRHHFERFFYWRIGACKALTTTTYSRHTNFNICLQFMAAGWLTSPTATQHKIIPPFVAVAVPGVPGRILPHIVFADG
jgi:hypothetical protein